MIFPNELFIIIKGFRGIFAFVPFMRQYLDYGWYFRLGCSFQPGYLPYQLLTAFDYSTYMNGYSVCIRYNGNPGTYRNPGIYIPGIVVIPQSIRCGDFYIYSLQWPVWAIKDKSSYYEPTSKHCIRQAAEIDYGFQIHNGKADISSKFPGRRIYGNLILVVSKVF